ncbi:MAG TPA: IPT/TIG domain-containing protein, partial [Acidimicrobiales bacterium]|nr:IPT/TIG domain-containing protein [Acidimicrobiales bacterium]
HSKGSGTTGVGAVASVGPDGTVHVMVYDFVPYDPSGRYGTSDPTPYDHPVTIKIVGLPRGAYDVDRTLIDATHDGTSVGTSTDSGASVRLPFTLAGDGVTLLAATHEPPSATKLSATSGPGAGGNRVTITGTSLGQASAVLFGGVPATNVSANGPGTRVRADAPPHAAGTVDVEVSTPWGTSSPDGTVHYTFEGPTIDRIAPRSGQGGTKVSVAGTDLQGVTDVVFGTAPAESFSDNASGTRITAYAPDQPAGPVDIEVTTPGGTDQTVAPDQFTYP